MPAPPTRGGSLAAYVVIVGWTAIYTWRGLTAFYSLNTNAFDLSVFDYALASLARGESGHVPFLGHSIFSHHFMPILSFVVPVRVLFESPAALLVVQIAAVATAAILFERLAARLNVAPLASAALVFAFLFSRRMHAAASSMFYPECFQAPMIFALVLAWIARAWRTYWIVLVLLLMTKEDAGLYAGAFAVLGAFRAGGSRRAALVTAAVSAAWVAVSVFVAIPMARAADGLPPGYEALQGRFGSPGGSIDPLALAGRLIGVATLERLAMLLAVFGFLPVMGALWLLPGVPGALINMAADPSTMQADLMNHYVWPVLPWIALAAASGWQHVHRRWRRAGIAWLAALVVFTAIDSPALQRLHRTRVDADAARAIEQLHGTVVDGVVLAQPNLIPHLRHHPTIHAVGGQFQPAATPDVVLLTDIGNLWPLSPEQARALIERYSADGRYERLTAGPLYTFRLR